jgi:putative transposase
MVLPSPPGIHWRSPRRSLWWPCFTPVRSPESNGVSEAFVKTLKRDYARIQPRPDAMTVLQQLPNWIEDYNENHPNSGLRMRSPREFIRSQSQPVSCPV